MLPVRPWTRWAAATVVLYLSAGGANADCTCRAGGRDFELGAKTCLPTPSGARIATCDMVLNNTSWRFSSTPCPAAQSEPPASKAAGNIMQRAAAARP